MSRVGIAGRCRSVKRVLVCAERSGEETCCAGAV